MHALTAYIEGIGLLGPGLNGWPGSLALLTGQQAYQPHPTLLPPPLSLPAAERRRSSSIVKLTLATGLEAVAAAGQDAAQLPCVFSASSGDGYNCHEICQMLASDDRQISPTRFHNSVHNAAAGYWSIATGAMTASSVLCAFDASFGAGLLEALAQVVVDNRRSLLLACDTPYPQPLHGARPIPDAFGVALVLAPRRSAQALAKISVSLSDAAAERLDDAALETLRMTIPAARSLPLLRRIAQGQAAHVVLDYLDSARLALDISPC
ncbi:beta-ketoacyl synthase chain length factor [Polaromonas jejuensis]|uniref:Beta-ketoacyl synthase chain length factor n=1 Tax=Polaromonas jejuensis TaxID=457502 RepID=A0ABW0Q487_9BURK|nr:beta-ketoacyl synthase chain length factor [Polaromonas jejuensis]